MFKIRWLGHASVMLKAGGKTIYIDPRYMKKMSDKVGKYFEKPEMADMILITHEHADHCYPSSFENMLKKDTEVVAPSFCNDKLDMDYIEVEPGESVTFDEVKVDAVWAYNVKRKRDSGEPFHPKGRGVGYLISYGGTTVYHAGDTENIEEMKEIGDIDLAFIPIDGTYTMDISEAIEAAKVLKPRIVVPIHERDSDPNEFKERLERESDIVVKVMEEGGVFELE